MTYEFHNQSPSFQGDSMDIYIYKLKIQSCSVVLPPAKKKTLQTFSTHLENKLLLISINFTPKLKKWYFPMFQTRCTIFLGVAPFVPTKNKKPPPNKTGHQPTSHDTTDTTVPPPPPSRFRHLPPSLPFFDVRLPEVQIAIRELSPFSGEMEAEAVSNDG